MAVQYMCHEVVERLRAQADAGRPLLMFGSGMGLTAKCADLGRG